MRIRTTANWSLQTANWLLVLMLSALIPAAACRSKVGHTTVHFCPAATAGKLFFNGDSAAWPSRVLRQLPHGDTLVTNIYDAQWRYIGAMKVVSREEAGDPSHYDAEIEIYFDVPQGRWEYVENSRHIAVYFRRGDWPPGP